MKNETVDAAVLSAVQAGISFRKDIVRRLVNDGLLLDGAEKANTQAVDNSLQRNRAAKKIYYVSPVQGWKVLS